MKSANASAVLALVGDGVLRARELDALGIPRVYLQRLVDAGELVKIDRGLYQRPGKPFSDLDVIAQVAKRIPHATICLLSALRIHEFIYAQPRQVWILRTLSKRRIYSTDIPLAFAHAEGVRLTHGVEERIINGVAVKVTTPAKTVVDCFRWRSRVGVEVAVDALREYLRRGKHGAQPGTYRLDSLLRLADEARLTNVIRPSLVALGAMDAT